MIISQHYITFPFYIPRICSIFKDWPAYLYNYVLRRKKPREYFLRNGFRLIDSTGTLAGTIAVVFVRQEYGTLQGFQTIIDIGANMGSFAVYAAQSCPKARIYCYEPEQRNFSFLSQNIGINSLDQRVTAFQYAVASNSGQRELCIGESPINSLVIGADNAMRQSVNCTTLKDIIADQKLDRIDLLKMNCEGAEYEILENCSPTVFERISNIRLEYHQIDSSTKNGDALARFLERQGYIIERFTQYRGISGFIWASHK